MEILIPGITVVFSILRWGLDYCVIDRVHFLKAISLHVQALYHASGSPTGSWPPDTIQPNNGGRQLTPQDLYHPTSGAIWHRVTPTTSTSDHCLIFLEYLRNYWCQGPCNFRNIPGTSNSEYIVFNTLKLRQNARHFADDIFKCIFLNGNEWISLRISLKFVLKVRINNIRSLVQIMAWRRPGDKPLSEPMVVSLLTHICVTRPQWVNGLSPEQNGCHFCMRHFEMHVLEWKLSNLT